MIASIGSTALQAAQLYQSEKSGQSNQTAQTSSSSGGSFQQALAEAGISAPWAKDLPDANSQNGWGTITNVHEIVGKDGGLGWPQLSVSPEERKAYISDLTAKLKAAGVDTSQAISFTTTSDGHVVAKDGTPDKDKIDAVMQANPDYENEYRKIGSTDALQAMGRVQRHYMVDYENAKSDKDRERVWATYKSQFDSISAAADNITLSNGSLTSAATTISSNFLS